METDELVAGAARDPLRVLPQPAQLQERGLVDVAQPRIQRQRVALRPRQRGLGPLGGAAEVTQLLARADHTAVDLAGRVGSQAALDRRQHGLVEVSEPVGLPAGVDEDPPDALQRHGFDVRRPQPPCERVGLGSQVLRPAELTASMSGLRLAEQQAGVLDAVAVLVEQAPGPPQPAVRDRRPGFHPVVPAERDGALACLLVVAAGLEEPVGLLAGRDAVVEATEPPRRRGDELETPGFVHAGVDLSRLRELQSLRPVPVSHGGVRGRQRGRRPRGVHRGGH